MSDRCILLLHLAAAATAAAAKGALVWWDDFDGDALNTSWWTAVDGYDHGDKELQLCARKSAPSFGEVDRRALFPTGTLRRMRRCATVRW